MTRRLQKLLAEAGVGSRREVDRWIQQGRIGVDGRVAEPGLKVSGRERITLDGAPLRIRLPKQRESGDCLIYHKPVGELCTRSDPEGRPTVFDALPKPTGGRWIIVGRLDAMTSGLLLVTRDGRLAHRLMHPSYQVEREYMCRVPSGPDAGVLDRLRLGIELDDGPARFDEVAPAREFGGHGWYRVVVREGRNRLVRRLWEAAGHPLDRLVRTRFGDIVLPRDLPAGRVRRVAQAARGRLYAAVGLDVP